MVLAAPGHFGFLPIHGGIYLSLVLSGYLMVRVYLNRYQRLGHFPIKQFFASRFRRLVPTATVLGILTLGAAYLFMSPLQLREIGTDGLYAAFPIPGINYHLAWQGTDYFADHTARPFQHVWSLALEEQFYILFPFAFALLGVFVGRKTGRMRLALGAALGIVTVASLTASVVTTHSNQPMAYFSLHTNAWILALGGLLALFDGQLKRLPAKVGSLLMWSGLAVIGFGAWYIHDAVLPSYLPIWPVTGMLMLMAGGNAARNGSASKVLSFRPLQYVGTISYQLYWAHFPILIIMTSVLGNLNWLEKLAGLTGTFAVAMICWHGWDKRLRTNKSYTDQPGKSFTLFYRGTIAFVAASLVTMFALAPSSNAAAPSGPAQAGENVEQFVTDATQLTKLPSDVESTLPAILKWDQSCITQPLDTTPKPCIMGDTSATQSWVMLGDSHTTHWAPAIDDITKRHHIKLVTYAKARCTGEPYTYNDYHLKRQYTECEQWREQIYRNIEATRPHAVLLSSAIYDNSSGDAVATIITRFAALGIKVVVFDDTPRSPFHIPQCLSQHTNNVQACAIPRETAMYRPTERAARENATVRNGGVFVRVGRWFCTNTMCPPVINGLVVYIDEVHVLRAYIVWLAPKLEAELAPALN